MQPGEGNEKQNEKMEKNQKQTHAADKAVAGVDSYLPLLIIQEFVLKNKQFQQTFIPRSTFLQILLVHSTISPYCVKTSTKGTGAQAQSPVTQASPEAKALTLHLPKNTGISTITGPASPFPGRAEHV